MLQEFAITSVSLCWRDSSPPPTTISQIKNKHFANKMDMSYLDEFLCDFLGIFLSLPDGAHLLLLLRLVLPLLSRVLPDKQQYGEYFSKDIIIMEIMDDMPLVELCQWLGWRSIYIDCRSVLVVLTCFFSSSWLF